MEELRTPKPVPCVRLLWTRLGASTLSWSTSDPIERRSAERRELGEVRASLLHGVRRLPGVGHLDPGDLVEEAGRLGGGRPRVEVRVPGERELLVLANELIR